VKCAARNGLSAARMSSNPPSVRPRSGERLVTLEANVQLGLVGFVRSKGVASVTDGAVHRPHPFSVAGMSYRRLLADVFSNAVV
jgi:hypothetical protein